MKNRILISASRGFSLVELLVVITILAIISTVAYTNLTGSTEKAKNSKRIEHLSSMETALMMYRQEKQYVPMPSASSATNYWGYNSAVNSTNKNAATLTYTADNSAITGVTGGSGGGKVNAIDGTTQIGAKWVMEQSLMGKQYLSQDIADPTADTKVGTDKTLKDFGIGRYVYAVYAKPTAGAWTGDKTATAFNVAVTVSDDQKGYVTKIGGDFDDKYGSCAGTCPLSLIGPGGATANLKDGDSAANIPYEIKY